MLLLMVNAEEALLGGAFSSEPTFAHSCMQCPLEQIPSLLIAAPTLFRLIIGFVKATRGVCL